MTKLTPETYHAEKKHLSSSFVKQFIKCEHKALYEREHPVEDKECFKEGRFFEVLVCGEYSEKAQFGIDNPDMFTKSGLKANYQKVHNAAEMVLKQDFLRNIIENSEKQKIFLGKINGVPMKIMLDLLYKDGDEYDVYDLKCMKDFKDTYDTNSMTYVPWFDAYKYPVQMYIYKEILEQNGIKIRNAGLIAATKEKVPDVSAIIFSDGWLEVAKAETFQALERYKQIKKGTAEPVRCGNCECCRETREILGFVEV